MVEGVRSKAVQGSLILGAGLALALGPDSFPFLAVRSFLVPIAVLLLAAACWWMFRGRHLQGAMLAVAALLAAVPPFQAWCTAGTGSGKGMPLIIAQMNVHEGNREHAAVVETALGRGADVIALQEVDERWWRALDEGLSDRYPWSVHGFGEKNHGIALFSRLPLHEADVFPLEELPAIRAVIGRDSLEMVVYALHLRAPEGGAKTALRNCQWESLAIRMLEERLPVCLVGDLNTVPWDKAFRDFRDQTGIRPGRYLLKPTWPALGPMALIPIDHLLGSNGLVIGAQETFRIPGSDHRGVLARVAAASQVPRPCADGALRDAAPLADGSAPASGGGVQTSIAAGLQRIDPLQKFAPHKPIDLGWQDDGPTGNQSPGITF